MATPRRTRAHRGGTRRGSGRGALIDTVRSTIGQLTRNRGRSSRGGNLAAHASGFIGGLLSGGDSGRGSRGGARRRR